MGWTFLYNTPDKSQVIEACTRGGEKAKCIRKATHGNELWTVWERTDTGFKFIVLFLLSKSRGSWGYKDMSEDMFPYFYKCPLSFLDDVPVANETWRARVRTYHENEKARRKILRNLKVGQTLRLIDGCMPNLIKVTSVRPLRGVNAHYTDGPTYTIKKSYVKEAIQ